MLKQLFKFTSIAPSSANSPTRFCGFKISRKISKEKKISQKRKRDKVSFMN